MKLIRRFSLATQRGRVLPVLALILLLAGLAVGALLGWQLLHDPGSDERAAPVTDSRAQLERGAYLAKAGNCIACHTARGGAPGAGARVIPTPFGNLYSSNITSDPETGLGKWSADEFWRALHNGRGRDGRFLYPAFPYPDYTRVTRSDSDALYAWLRTVPAVRQQNLPHALRFPYDQQLLLAGWRALYFRPGVQQAEPTRSEQWNRGAYLVQGLGHCGACHTPRNALGASVANAELAGGLIPMLNWYAPALTSDAQAGLGTWQNKEIAELLKTGVSARGAVFGPMSEVVRESLQHLSPQDIDAMAVYLKSLPATDALASRSATRVKPVDDDARAVLKLGATIYEKRCAECHKADGSGKPPAFPPLAGNRSLTHASVVNPIRIVLNGGYPPSTAGNPWPYGMPPSGPFLNDAEVAAVVSYVRNAWGNQGGMVNAVDVSRYRTVPVE